MHLRICMYVLCVCVCVFVRVCFGDMLVGFSSHIQTNGHQHETYAFNIFQWLPGQCDRPNWVESIHVGPGRRVQSTTMENNPSISSSMILCVCVWKLLIFRNLYGILILYMISLLHESNHLKSLDSWWDSINNNNNNNNNNNKNKNKNNQSINQSINQTNKQTNKQQKTKKQRQQQ